MDWTEKYRPKSLSQLVGNGPAVAQLRDWAVAWQDGPPEKRAVVLAGPPGTGKTSTALALANDMGWAVIELNASDARNAERIRRVATAGALHQTFNDDGSFGTGADGGWKLIILDEADNLYERLGSDSGGAGSELSDRGGKAQIIKTIRETRQPIVLIVNDLYALTKGSGSALKSLALEIKFTRVNVRSIPKALASIAAQEQIRVDREVLEAIAARASGDLRAAVRDLESLCAGRTHVTVKELGALGPRDTAGSVFDAVRHILKGRKMDEIRREVMDLDQTPEDLILWLDENTPKEYKDPQDLVRAYEMLSKADRFLGRTRSTQNYGLWGYASQLMTLGVMTARQNEYRGYTPLGFPQWLSKMSRSRGARQTKDALALALGAQTHQSKRKARMHQVEPFTTVFGLDDEFAAWQTWRMELGDEQVSVLLREKTTSKRVKELRAAVERLEEDAGPVEAKGLAWGGSTGDEASAAPGRVDVQARDKTDEGQEPEGEPAPDESAEEKRPKEPGEGQSTLFGF